MKYQPHRHVVQPTGNGCVGCAVELDTLRRVQQLVSEMPDNGLTAGGTRVAVVSMLARMIFKVEDR